MVLSINTVKGNEWKSFPYLLHSAVDNSGITVADVTVFVQNRHISVNLFVFCLAC